VSRRDERPSSLPAQLVKPALAEWGLFQNGAGAVQISADYPQPVRVNGFTCKNCTEVDEAKKHIDPAHPKSGPYGVNAASDPTVKPDPLAQSDAQRVKAATAPGVGGVIDISI